MQAGVRLNAERQLLTNQKFFRAYMKLFTLEHILYIRHIRLKKTNFDVFTVKIGTLLQSINSRGDWNMQAMLHNIQDSRGLCFDGYTKACKPVLPDRLLLV